jgi:hypothetical protein
MLFLSWLITGLVFSVDQPLFRTCPAGTSLHAKCSGNITKVTVFPKARQRSGSRNCARSNGSNTAIHIPQNILSSGCSSLREQHFLLLLRPRIQNRRKVIIRIFEKMLLYVSGERGGDVHMPHQTSKTVS